MCFGSFSLPFLLCLGGDMHASPRLQRFSIICTPMVCRVCGLLRSHIVKSLQLPRCVPDTARAILLNFRYQVGL